MDHLHIRCPSCAKLYVVETGRIFSSTPEFQCQVCETRFTFDFPPRQFDQASTRVVAPREAAIKMRKCPRCAAENPDGRGECLSCGVIFEKLEDLPLDSGLRVRPSLVRRWKELLSDYTNESLHHAFIEACREQMAMEYARIQYREIQRLQGRDDIAARMLAQVDAIASVVDSQKNEKVPRPQVVMDLPKKAEDPWASWKKVGLFVPYILGLILVLWGLSRIGHRHLTGLGMAILVLSFVLLPEAKETLFEIFQTRKNRKVSGSKLP